MRFLQTPHFERFEDFGLQRHAVFFSQMKKKLEKLATFAKNDYFCTVKTPCFGGVFFARDGFSNFRKIICENFLQRICLKINHL